MFRYRLGDISSSPYVFTIFTIGPFKAPLLSLRGLFWGCAWASAMSLLLGCTKGQLPVSLVKLDLPENPDIRVQMLIEGDAKSPFSHLVHVPSSAPQTIPGHEKYIAIKYCDCEIAFSRRSPASEFDPISDQANLNIRPNVSILPWKKIDLLNVSWIKVRKDDNLILFAWDKDVLQEIILKNEKNELFVLYFEKTEDESQGTGGTP